jgi:hypothetical protein
MASWRFCAVLRIKIIEIVWINPLGKPILGQKSTFFEKKHEKSLPVTKKALPLHPQSREVADLHRIMRK